MASSRRVVSSLSIVRQLWSQAQLPTWVLENTLRAGNLVLTHDPAEVGQAIRSSFQLTAVAQGCCAAIALAEVFRCALMRCEAVELDKLVLDRVEVDARQAIAEYKGWVRLYTGQTDVAEMLRDSIAVDSDEGRKVLRVDENAVADWDALAGLYRTQTDPRRSVPGLVRIHTNFPHHKLGILQLLGLASEEVRWNDEGIYKVFAGVTRQDVQRQLERWDAFEFETAAQGRGLCVTAYRSRSEWEQSEMGRAVKDWMDDNIGSSAFRISRVQSAASPEQATQRHTRRSHSDRLKVIDISRVIAGPISTRTLAAHGADVLLLSSPHLPNLPLRELDTARGKRTAFVDLPRNDTPPASLTELLRGADVFSQAYRPHGLAERGLSAEAVQTIRPGIVYAELCAFGFAGPWKDRRAYDSLTQTACGMNYLESLSYSTHLGEEGEVEPKALPVQALDYAAGSLMCFATLACTCRALIERSTGRGQGWRVQVSLASTAEWIQSLGQMHGEEAWTNPPPDVVPVEDRARLAEMVSSYRVRGLKTQEDVRVLAIRHAAIPASTMSEHQEDLRWTVPGHLGVDQLTW